MTPHNKANKKDIAKYMLMAGDPLRAKLIADTYLTDVKLVNDVRNMYCYTGKYEGLEVSVMGHGMGNPSIGIYSYELFKFYDVDVIVRIGTAGSYKDFLDVGSIFCATDSISYSPYAREMGLFSASNTLKASENLVKTFRKIAEESKVNVTYGKTYSSDTFYTYMNLEQTLEYNQNADCVEMEAFALYTNAKVTNKEALTVLTISDSFITKKLMTPEERKNNLHKAIVLGLKTLVAHSKK